MNPLARLSLPSAFVVLLACSPASVGSGSAGGPSVQQACADSAYARCSHLRTCSAFALELRYGDITTCETSFRTSCMQNLLAPSTGSTPSGTEACVQKIPDWDCVDFTDFVNPPPECSQYFGSRAAGAACAVNSQCQTGFCAIDPGNSCGVCAALPQANTSCQHLTGCGQNLSCQTVTQICAAFGGVDAPCGTGLPCAPGLGCAGYDAATNTLGKCEPAVTTVNATCDPKGAGCDFDSGLVCSGQTPTCVPIVLVGGGQPCGTVGGQEQRCGAGGTCVGAMGTTPGTCQAAVATGAACDLMKGPPCFPPSRCIATAPGGTSGTCQVPDPSHCD